jgi:predicted ABC-type ATPase
MERFEQEIILRNLAHKASLAKSMGNIELFETYLDLINKSRAGIYKDNPENRRLHRVGMHYGHTSEDKLSTEEKYFKNGSWDKERVEKVHKPIIRKYLNKVKQVSDTPTVTLMMGAPANGKGTVRKYLIERGDLNDDIVVDPDDIKTEELKDDFERYRKVYPKGASQKVHKEGSYIADKIKEGLSNLGADFILDKTFVDYDKLSKTVRDFGERGYNVKIVAVQLPNVNEAIRRMESRGKRTGRYVPREFIQEVYNKFSNTFEKLIQNIPENVVSIQRFDTSSAKPELKYNYKK